MPLVNYYYRNLRAKITSSCMCDVNSGRKCDMLDCRCDVNPYHRPRRYAVHSTGFPNVRDEFFLNHPASDARPVSDIEELRHARARRRSCALRAYPAVSARVGGAARPAGARRKAYGTSNRADQYKAGLHIPHRSVQQILVAVCCGIHIN